jgi:hypothetical protein
MNHRVPPSHPWRPRECCFHPPAERALCCGTLALTTHPPERSWGLLNMGRQCFEWATCAPSPPCFSPSKCTFRMLYRTKGAKHGAHKNEVSQRSLTLLGTSRKIVYTCRRIPGTCETHPPGRTDSHCHSPPQTTASQFSMSSTAEPKGELGAERTRRRLLGEGGGWAQNFPTKERGNQEKGSLPIN